MPDPPFAGAEACDDARVSLSGRGRAVVSSGTDRDPDFERELRAHLESHPHDADLWNTLGIVITCPKEAGGLPPHSRFGEAAQHFERAVRENPFHALAALNLVELFLATNERDRALEHATKLLRLM